MRATRNNSAEAKEVKEARKRLHQMRGTGFVLTPDAAKLIMTAGGPTFRTISGGYRCNQTGEKVGRGGTKNYCRRVYGLTDPPKPVVVQTNASASSSRRTVQSHIPEIDITSPDVFIRCPNPLCEVGIGYTNLMIEGIGACPRCNKQFRKIRHPQSVQKTQPSPTGNINCPHCHARIAHIVNFSNFYSTIECQFCHRKLIVE